MIGYAMGPLRVGEGTTGLRTWGGCGQLNCVIERKAVELFENQRRVATELMWCSNLRGSAWNIGRRATDGGIRSRDI